MNKDVFYDKIYGCWLGKNIGGTLGTPGEGDKNPAPLPLEFPKSNEPNDDLDLQLVWLDMMNKKGVDLTAADFAGCWLNNITYPFDEYGICVANIQRGLKPPQTGVFNNYFHDCMGSPIRSEIWGCLCPGMPETAAYYALQDAQLDHGEEGIYGEILFACMESIAFVEEDIVKITEESLEFLPESSLVKNAVQITLKAWNDKVSLEELKGVLVDKFGVENFSNCVINIAFTIAGLLYSDMDFLKSMVMSVNLGWDTDCTGATAGAIVGIVMGYKAIKEQYDVEFDNRIIAGWGVTGINPPATIDDMTRQTIALNEKLTAMNDRPALPKFYAMPKADLCDLSLNREFMVSNKFSSAKDAMAALEDKKEFVKIKSATDVVDIFPFIVDEKPLCLATTIKLPKTGKYKISSHSNANVKLWINDEFIVEDEARDFSPSPHRSGNFEVTQYDTTELKVFVEIDHKGKNCEFALLTADEKMFHIVEAEYKVI